MTSIIRGNSSSDGRRGQRFTKRLVVCTHHVLYYQKTNQLNQINKRGTQMPPVFTGSHLRRECSSITLGLVWLDETDISNKQVLYCC